MSSIVERLHSGQRWWAAELAFRVTGVGLLAGTWHCARIARRWLTAAPPHQPTPGEFGVCAAVFLLLTAGIALALEGPGLWRHVPIPRHSAFFRSGDA